MGNLPEAGITSSRSFDNTGVDYGELIFEQTTKGRGHSPHKAFLCLWICFSTKAVPIELVSDYVSAAFMAAYKRFVSRRGLCVHLYSDCGATFVSSDNEWRLLPQK